MTHSQNPFSVHSAMRSDPGVAAVQVGKAGILFQPFDTLLTPLFFPKTKWESLLLAIHPCSRATKLRFISHGLIISGTPHPTHYHSYSMMQGDVGRCWHFFSPLSNIVAAFSHFWLLLATSEDLYHLCHFWPVRSLFGSFWSPLAHPVCFPLIFDHYCQAAEGACPFANIILYALYAHFNFKDRVPV